MNKFSSTAGFTLIEVLVVVVIIGMLSALGISKFGVARERAQASQAKTLCAKLNDGIQHMVLDDILERSGSGWLTTDATGTYESAKAAKVTPSIVGTYNKPLHLLVVRMLALNYIDTQTATGWHEILDNAPTYDSPIYFACDVAASPWRNVSITTTARSDTVVVQAN